MTRPPDDAAYGRVTQPERYASLQVFARHLIDDLQVNYDAEITLNGSHATDHSALEAGDSLRVCPRTGGGGCLSLRNTPFPGVILEVGRSHSLHFPRCGCDACDEQLSELMNDMADVVEAFVDGRFTEYLEGGRLGHRWFNARTSASGWSALDDADPRRDQSETIQWKPWSRRPIQP